MVNNNLSSVSAKTDHLLIIQDICNEYNVTCIATLCHDTHLETFLMKQGISLEDGFSEPEDGIRYWNNHFTSHDSIPLLKLHGSVNWSALRPRGGNEYDEQIGIVEKSTCHNDRTGVEYFFDKIHQKLPPQEVPLYKGEAELLMGTLNKTSRYSKGIFLDIHYCFRSKTDDTDRMVICGYSFGDRGINSHLTNWFYGKRGRRFVIIHPKPDDLITNAHPSIQEWLHKNRTDSIQFIEKYRELYA